MATIPANQEKLHALADALLLPVLFPMTNEDIGRQIRLIANDLSRRPAATKSKPKSRHCTPALKAQMRDYHYAHPDLSLQEIADLFGVNPARVSEAISGKRK